MNVHTLIYDTHTHAPTLPNASYKTKAAISIYPVLLIYN